MNHIGYTMTLETRIVRRKHLVTFRIGMKVGDFMKVLEKVPSDATIDEVLDDAGGIDTCSILFHEERLDK